MLGLTRGEVSEEEEGWMDGGGIYKKTQLLC